MRLGTPKEFDKVVKKATDWYNNKGGRFHFHNSKNGAISAVAEFLANKEGFTIYDSKVDLKSVCGSCYGSLYHLPGCGIGEHGVIITEPEKKIFSSQELECIIEKEKRRIRDRQIQRARQGQLKLTGV